MEEEQDRLRSRVHHAWRHMLRKRQRFPGGRACRTQRMMPYMSPCMTVSAQLLEVEVPFLGAVVQPMLWNDARAAVIGRRGTGPGPSA